MVSFLQSLSSRALSFITPYIWILLMPLYITLSVKNLEVKGWLFLRTTSYSLFQVLLACSLQNNLFSMNFYRLYLISLYNFVNQYYSLLLNIENNCNLLGFWKYYMEIVLYEYHSATEYHRTDWLKKKIYGSNKWAFRLIILEWSPSKLFCFFFGSYYIKNLICS